MKRSQILQKALDRASTQRDSAERLDVTQRHFRRLLQKARQTSPLKAVASTRRGRPSNRTIPAEVREKALELKLPKAFCAETQRRWMTQAGLHGTRRQPPPCIHQLRHQRDRFGEMLQTDGSLHYWPGEDKEPFTLLVLIDDATSRVTAARFVPHEDTADYMRLLGDHVRAWGCPYSLYSDRHSIFSTANSGNLSPVPPNSPVQHKTRALTSFMPTPHKPRGAWRGFSHGAASLAAGDGTGRHSDHGTGQCVPSTTGGRPQPAQFAIEPHFPEGAHELLEMDKEQLSRNLTCRYKNCLYQALPRGEGYMLRGTKILLMETLEGEVPLHGRGRDVPYEVCERGERQPEVQSTKGVNAQVDEVIKQRLQTSRPPDPNHPWRRFNPGWLSK